MPRTTRTQEPADPRAPRRAAQDALALPGASESQAAGRRARGRSADSARSATQGATAGARDTEQPAYDDIARRAYELYQERGGNEGQDMDDWLRAEAELRQGRGRREDEL
jgi:hypothetical protein